VAPEMVEQGDEGEAASSPSSDARADVWSWGVLLHALLTRSTATAKGKSISASLTMMEGERWRDEVAALWGPEELPTGVLEALKYSLCERGERVGLLAGAVLLGQQGLVEEVVWEMDAPEEVKKAEHHIAMLESLMVATPRSVSPPSEHLPQADFLVSLADSHVAVGDEVQAVACLQQASRLFLDGSDSTQYANILDKLAMAYSRRGDYGAAAAALFSQVVDVRRRLLPEDHLDTASSLNNFANCLSSLGEYGKAVLLHENALVMKRRLLPEDHPDIASSLVGLASCHGKQREYGKAVLLLQEALAKRRRLLPEDHPDIASSLMGLASCHGTQGEYGKAVLLHEEALAMKRRLLPEDHPHIAASLSNLGICLKRQGEYGKAVVLHEEALAMQRRLLPENHPDIAMSMNNLATCYERQGEYGKAVVLHEEALAMKRRLLPVDHLEIVSSLLNLATCHQSQGEYGKAVLLHEESLAMRRRLLPKDHPDLGWSVMAVGKALGFVDDYAGALRHLEEALAILSMSLPEDHPHLLQISSCVQSLTTVVGPSPGPPAPAPQEARGGAAGGEVVDWSSKSVHELKAFLRSRGMDVEGEPDVEDLLQAATALAEQHREEPEGRQGL
jgi:tetratricopeptide (TPR) repeat protein